VGRFFLKALWPTALSAGASDYEWHDATWLSAGYAFAHGLSQFGLAGGLLVGTWANWLFCCKTLRTLIASLAE